ncbi:MAG: type I DNA topoisomerase [Deltaproteobacteria bacterium]|nr:type I DNA topoisomerase [Deltaproteobacteria bacterium]
MPKSLVIVESPAKANTINKFLGKDFIVKASIGHIKDLPKNKLGVDVENNFTPYYETIKGKGKIISELKKAAKSIDKIYLAPDPDREGEAIAWHIAEELNGHGKDIYRVLFNEITEKGVLEAITKPGKLDKNKFESQQARRILDRLVGYQVSPILWEKVRRGLSAGRVQSVAVRLIVEREREIRAFVPEEYWSITAELEKTDGQGSGFKAKLVKKDDEKLEIKNGDDANKILKDIEGKDFAVRDIEKKERKRNPMPPFITSKLQQDAARKLGFTARKTMMIAQQLYEGVELGTEGSVGLITYMRTDSTRVSPDAVMGAREYILSRFGKGYLPSKPNSYPSKKGAQDAHEAIRPTYIQYTPDSVKKYLMKDHFLLYQLVWNRFIASQMMPAVFDQTAVLIESGRYIFQANGSVLKFSGWTLVYTEARDGDEEVESELPILKKGEILKLLGLLSKQHFTQPPPRFTEAALIKELEENGIGRPSTYAAIIATIQDRKYVVKEKNQFIPSELGFVVTDLLVKSFPDILNVEFTAHMEEDLDNIEDGKLKWLDAMNEFYTPFKKSMEKAKVEMKDVKRHEVPTDINCDKCGKTMMVKWGRNGEFLACSGYPECKNTKEFKIDENGKVMAVEPLREETDERCPNCGKPMLIKTGRFGRFLACSDYPSCKTAKPLSIGVKCPVEGCGGEMVERQSKKSRLFYSCSNYPKCRYALWDKPINEKCPECGFGILIEKGSNSGKIIKCPNQGCEYEGK